MQKSAVKQNVTIPMFSHSQVDQILAINDQLLQILLEYQNGGWGFSAFILGCPPDLKLYQQRLHSNLTYLAQVF